MKQAFGAKLVKFSIHSKCWSAGNRKNEQPIFGFGVKKRLSAGKLT
jgi:hypothetical protein